MRASLKVGENELILETGKLAKQADGAVTVRYGDTVVLAAAVAAKNKREGVDFLPLTVDYREKTYAAGRFPGGYIKREARPTEKEILSARLIDRPIRPLFPEGYFYEIQVMASVLSADDENDPDIIALNAASAALALSDIPFLGPVGAVRVGLIDGRFIINPSYSQLNNSRIDMIIAGTKDGISMIEGHTKGVSEEVLADAVEFAYGHIREIASLEEGFRNNYGRSKKDAELVNVDESIYNAVKAFTDKELDTVIRIKEKLERQDALRALKKKAQEELQAQFPDTDTSAFGLAFHRIEKEKIRNIILRETKRCDGRSVTEVRPISCETGILPRTHGSALFTRGETQSLAVTTLGSSSDEQRIEGYTGEFSKVFMLHYNFPPFSVGEVKPVRGPGRREIGHGALAEKSLLAVIPEPAKFPYTIRVVSDILESNGSSSMATICAGCMSLMDAGVPVKELVAGIAMGLVKEGGKEIILTDIIGAEDACGDMDFKVAGTRANVTGFQLDVKLKKGISIDTIRKGLAQAHTGRLHILDKMGEVIKSPRESLSPYAPQIKMIQIDPDKIGTIIGPGGRMIKQIIADTGADINVDDSGKVSISSSDGESIAKAVKMIEDLTHEVKPGEIYEGIVKTVTDFGAFVEILPGKSGLVHVSELANHFVKKTEDEVKQGEKIKVIVTDIDSKGRINLSKKRLEQQAKT